MLEVSLLGTGGMMPLPRRWLTSLMIRFSGHDVLIDCGEGTQIAMNCRGWSPKPIDLICITHFHADHVSGLPGMLLAIANAGRTEPLTIMGPKGLNRVVSAARVIAPELPYEVRVEEYNGPRELAVGEPDGQGQLLVRSFKVLHNVTCYGYTVYVPRIGSFDVDAAKSLNIPVGCWNRLQHGQTVQTPDATYTPDMVMGPPRPGLRVTYTTDTRPVQNIVDAARNADLFVCEGMYGEPELAGKARDRGHMMFTEAAGLARKAEVKRLWLTHYSPSILHPEDFMAPVRKIFPGAVAAKDGQMIDLNYVD